MSDNLFDQRLWSLAWLKSLHLHNTIYITQWETQSFNHCFCVMSFTNISCFKKLCFSLHFCVSICDKFVCLNQNWLFLFLPTFILILLLCQICFLYQISFLFIIFWCHICYNSCFKLTNTHTKIRILFTDTPINQYAHQNTHNQYAIYLLILIPPLWIINLLSVKLCVHIITSPLSARRM